MKLSNFRISVKVLMIVGLLSAVTVIVGALGYVNTERLGEATKEVDLARFKANLGTEITADIRGMSRYEYRVAANPTLEAIQQSERNAAAYRKEIEGNFTRIKATADAEQRRLLEAIERETGTYFTTLAATFQLARELPARRRSATRSSACTRARAAAARRRIAPRSCWTLSMSIRGRRRARRWRAPSAPATRRSSR